MRIQSSEGNCPTCDFPLGIGGDCPACAIGALEPPPFRSGPVCAICGGSMIHSRLNGYHCHRSPDHQGIRWPEGSPQAEALKKADERQLRFRPRR